MNECKLREQFTFAKKSYTESVVKCVCYGCSPFWDYGSFGVRRSEDHSYPVMIGVVSGFKVNQLNRKIMSVNVNYKNRMGYCTLTQGENKFKIWICHANCLFAMMYFYKNEEGKDMVQLHSFLADLEHAKRCLKADLFKDYSNFVFVAKELNNDMWKFIRELTKYGFKVTIK